MEETSFVIETLLWIVVVIIMILIIYPTEHNSEEPLYPECFDCKESTCEGCLAHRKKEVI
jgi:hypothetical protein